MKIFCGHKVEAANETRLPPRPELPAEIGSLLEIDLRPAAGAEL